MMVLVFEVYLYSCTSSDLITDIVLVSLVNTTSLMTCDKPFIIILCAVN